MAVLLIPARLAELLATPVEAVVHRLVAVAGLEEKCKTRVLALLAVEVEEALAL
jgi:hypothetical protein